MNGLSLALSVVFRWLRNERREEEESLEANVRRGHRYRIYPCISRPFMASKEAPKNALDLYTGQRFRAKFQLNNLFKLT